MRRSQFLLLTFLVSLFGCGTAPTSNSSNAPPAARQGPSEYALAREQFSTKLIFRRPPPQPPSSSHFNKLKKPEDVEMIEYLSGDLKLKAWTQTAPSSDKKLPAVLFLHGGWGFDESDWEHTRAFRDAGFVVLAPMLRGECGCPGDFSMFYNEVDDVIAARDYLARLPYVDPDRIFMAGYSAGGTHAMLATMTTNRFRAVASLDGSPDRRAFIRGREDEVPFDTSNPEEFRMRSPRDFATSFQCPIRFFCSDDVGGFTAETRRMANTARKNGLDVEMVSVAGDHATFREPATRLAIKFFRERE